MNSARVILLLCLSLSLFISFSEARKDPTLKEVFEFLDTYYSSTPFVNDIGNCDFPITSKNSSLLVKRYSDMGMCMLHTFWPSESLRAFREILKMDDQCAMAYWGVYQSLVWDSGYQKAADEAKQLAMSHVTETLPNREKLYIETLKYNTTGPWNATYYKLFADSPNDLNAKGLWAWARISDTINAMGNPFKERSEVQNFLQKEVGQHENDVGMQHYTIHAWEDTLHPENAKKAAIKLPTISKNAGHNVHMSGHIYFLLGDHDTAHSYFNQGKQVDETMMKMYDVTFQEYWEYIHNIAYMVGNLAEGGRYTESIELGSYLANLKINYSRPALLDWDPRFSRPAGRFFFQGLLALPLVQFLYSNWAEAEYSLGLISQSGEFYKSNNISSWLPLYYEGLQKYACVMKNFKHFINSQDLQFFQAQACSARIAEILELLDPYMNKANENGFQVGQRLYISLGVNYNETVGVMQAMRADYTSAFQTFLNANASEFAIPYNEPPIYSRPVLASYIDLKFFLQSMEKQDSKKKPILNEMITIYDNILRSSWHRDSGIFIFGQAQTYELLGKSDIAKSRYYDFLNAWKSADQNLYMVQYAKAFIEDRNATVALWAFFVAVVLALLLGGGVGGGILWMRMKRQQKNTEVYVPLDKRSQEDTKSV